MTSIFSSGVLVTLGPLPPQAVALSNKGHPDQLSAAWEPPEGEREGYALTLYYAGSGTVAAKTSVQKRATNFTFFTLLPGTKYLLEVSSLAGPYRMPARNVSGWTCESASLRNLLVFSTQRFA